MKPWCVVRDASGHFRAMETSRFWPADGEEEVDGADSYPEACGKADRLNEVAAVMDC